jgi:hypothetical protein
LNDERTDFGPLDAQRSGREQRVVGRVMAEIATRAAPRSDLAGAIVRLGPTALAAAAALALVVRLGSGAQSAERLRPPTVGTALGMPPAAERVIRSPEPVNGWELLTAFQDDR